MKRSLNRTFEGLYFENETETTVLIGAGYEEHRGAPRDSQYPMRSKEAYRSYIEHLWARNALALGIGEALERVLSILQGCPP